MAAPTNGALSLVTCALGRDQVTGECCYLELRSSYWRGGDGSLPTGDDFLITSLTSRVPAAVSTVVNDTSVFVRCQGLSRGGSGSNAIDWRVEVEATFYPGGT